MSHASIETYYDGFGRTRGWHVGWRIGVDIGGTFTDVALIDEESGGISFAKVPTTTQDFAEWVIAGLQQGLMRCGLEPAAVSLLSHATTVVTNALLEKKGAKRGSWRREGSVTCSN